ncbi:uncharacterized protein PHACADRAFT_95787 [Phanerochaete carnosa HHB-10118-sp]|uniref:Uncharacterized protein n=1 Tax=Phanerochaete carnosa (strain HHB-10118-sp) TaxID=650164 RepID=K5WX60_PHACS|nr:uncharacterized protein PHACADRAFT_95787 [Phanerochaete carnosa HHB-10118-sp]EKM55072.1 hypothetical protein PHACADRAFT_95787 [Phanerochaete carnosa HHB-10118-sp]
MSLPLSGKVAIVTGSSRGIGAAIARRLATDGAHVVVNYNGSEAAAGQVVADINNEAHGRAVAIQADLSSVEEGVRLVEDTVKSLGRLDILVHNAAFKTTGELDAVGTADFDTQFSVNVRTPLFVTQAAARHLPKGGRVVFVTSNTTKTSAVTPEYLVYTASKGAAEQLVRVLAKDLGRRGITVNAVSPGATDTEFFREDCTSAAFVEYVTSQFPQRQIPVAEDIAPLVAFLARDEAGWVNGQCIMVNGVGFCQI